MLRYAGVSQLLLFLRHLCLIGVLYVRNKEQTPQRHMLIDNRLHEIYNETFAKPEPKIEPPLI